MLFTTFVVVVILVYIFLGILALQAVLRGLKEVDICDKLRNDMVIPPRWLPFMRPPSSLLPSRLSIYLRAFFVAPLGALYVPIIFFMATVVGVVTRKNPSWIFPYVLPLMMWLLGFKVVVKGKPETVPLYVSNHSAIFDPTFIATVVSFVTAVAKIEVSRLPFIGMGMKSLGAIFVDRQDADNRKAAADAISNYLNNWNETKPTVIIFPEGTTTNNTEILPFKLGAFQTTCKFQAVRIEYPNPHCAFACSTSALVPLVVCLSMGGGDITLTFFPSTSKGNDESAEQVAERARRTIAGDRLKLASSDSGYRSHVEITSMVADIWEGKAKSE